MPDLKICRICLRTEAKMYKYDRFHLKYYYEEVMALKMDENDSLPKYYCYECATMLHKFHKFKEKCYIGQKALKQMLWKGPLTYESIYKLDRTGVNLQSPLSIMTITDLVKKYVIQEETHTKQVKDENIEPIESYFTDPSPQFCFDYVIRGNDEMISKNCIVVSDNNMSKKEKGEENKPSSPQTTFVDTKRESIKLKSGSIKDKKIKSGTCYRRFLNSRHWKTIILTEEEAVNEFRSKANNKQYMAALFKCQDCFRGFSKEDMLKRHLFLRHSESEGVVECHFCRMRFKYKSFLSKHLSQHYVRYECLRCGRICPFETSAMMHEEYHNGITIKCMHCNEEFRHKSTYYSHMRTHRSDFVCALCGSSFVSERGLKNHNKIKHVRHDVDSSDDEDGVNTHCDKCEIRFGSRKAFEEHLFQSAMHSDGIGDQMNVECLIPRKILGKKEKAKITNELRKRKDDNMSPLVSHNTKRKKRQKRNRRKPTTCHQCGVHFDTQAACMKHHLSAHPGTSFFPPTVRHICEICGASLAPGSVAVHQNIHTREKVHTCDTCGKQFHSTIGLRRHLVTHTGEKPFGCPLCDKHFTQSNSMKLHYRTFHLKEPYPKRNRKKHKGLQENAHEAEVSHSEPDSDCVPESEMNSLPEPPGIEPVPDTVENHIISDEPIQYMPL